jgi:hypothetical protein
LFFELYDSEVLEVNKIRGKMRDKEILKRGFQKTFHNKKFTSMREKSKKNREMLKKEVAETRTAQGF